MHDYDINIKRMQNGYTVRITDPAIVKANAERDKAAKGDCVPWRDSQVSYAFTTSAEVLEFLKNNIDKAMPDDEFSSTFDAAVKDSK